MTDLVVVGAGLVGCCIARDAAMAGMQVTVIERGTPGGEASWAAAGMLSPLAEASGPGPFTDFLLRARGVYPAFAAALQDETGIDVGYSDAGTLYLALLPEDDAELDHRWRWQSAAGLPVQHLSARDALALEPAIAPGVRWALRFPGDHQVDNRALTGAVIASARAAGVQFRTGEAAALLHEAGRATGVALASGERLAGDAVVIAGGSWAGDLAGLPRPLPVEPVAGQLLALETSPPIFRHVVDSPRCYLVPRSDGRLIAGATVERVGFRKEVTPRGQLQLMAGAVEIAPGLADVPLRESWAGLRPGTPDGRPILGPDPELAGLFYATGHYRNGILLAPLTADLMLACLTGSTPADLAPYSVVRFRT